jgi:hypothetical protein
MLPQGQSISNQAYFDSLISQIEKANSCDDLRRLASVALLSITAEQGAIQDQLSKLVPIIELLKPPTNLFTLLTWAGKIITYVLTPMVTPYYNYAAQLAQMAIHIAALQEAINSASSKFTECSIEIPDIPNVEIPPPPT